MTPSGRAFELVLGLGGERGGESGLKIGGELMGCGAEGGGDGGLERHARMSDVCRMRPHATTTEYVSADNLA